MVFLSQLRRGLIGGLVGGLTVACATEDEQLLERGFPPAYASGYGDGCESGHKAGGDPFSNLRKDPTRFAGDNLYQQGWEDGFNTCEGEERARQAEIQRIVAAQNQHVEEKKRKHSLERELERDLKKLLSKEDRKKLRLLGQ